MFHLLYLHTTARKHDWTTNWFLCWFLLILLSTLQSATCYTNFIFSSSLPDILRRGECRSISTSYCLGVMAFYPLVTDPDNNSDIYLSGWTLVCTRHIQLSCIFPQLLYSWVLHWPWTACTWLGIQLSRGVLQRKPNLPHYLQCQPPQALIFFITLTW